MLCCVVLLLIHKCFCRVDSHAAKKPKKSAVLEELDGIGDDWESFCRPRSSGMIRCWRIGSWMSGFRARHEFGASLFVEQFSGSVSWCISAQLALCKEDMPRKQMLTVSHIVVAHFCRFKTWFLKDEFGDLEIQGQHSSSSKILAVANNCNS